VAQAVGGTNFDFGWDNKTNRCLFLLREAADLWASSGRGALDTNKVVAAFLQVLTRRINPLVATSTSWPNRFFTETSAEFATPQESCLSCQQLAPARSTEEFTVAIGELNGAVRRAAAVWVLGDPENPSTSEVLHMMLAILWDRHLAARPPSKAYPQGL
jgi:hypothetical protein